MGNLPLALEEAQTPTSFTIAQKKAEEFLAVLSCFLASSEKCLGHFSKETTYRKRGGGRTILIERQSERMVAIF